jgi:hypothetical protein
MLLNFALLERIGTFAYIGPGADLSLISSVIGLVLTLAASGFFIVLWPFRMLWRRIRGFESSTMDTTLSEPEST